MKSVISEKIYIHKGGVDKIGMFANDFILKGEIVYIKGGHILTRDEFFSSGTINSYLPISDNYVLGAISAQEENSIKLYNNHSCNSNCSMRGDIVFISTRNISMGEELTVDYAFIDNEPYRFKCTCGQPSCRRIVTGYDWQLKTVQEKYERNCFSNYIQSKIEAGIAFDVRQSIDKQIKTLRTSVFVEELGFKTENEFSEDENNYKHCCLYKNGQLVAYARVLIKGSVAHISRVAVKQDERNKGYGRQIIFWAETEALKCGVSNAQINALDSIRTFYEKLNYTPLGDVFISEEKSHIKMKKILSLDA